MTDEEKHQQIGRLVLEYQQAEQHLAHLREKAASAATAFIQVGDWLKRVSAGQPQFGRNEQARKSAETVASAEALKLIDEIAEAQRTLADLAQRKAALGLK